MILETVAAPDDSHNLSWFHTSRRIKKCGWSNSALRAFQQATEPTYKIKRPGGTAISKPPSKNWCDIEWRQIAEIDVEFPNILSNQLNIPDEALPEVFAILQWNLFRAVDRLEECGKQHFRLNSLYQGNINEGHYVTNSNSFVLYFVSLLDRMVEIKPTSLKGHINTWPQQESYIFDKLRLYVLNKPELFNSQAVAAHILSIDNTKLWNLGDKQELLFLLRDRWLGFNVDERTRIGARILDGRPQYPREGAEQYELHRDETAAIYFGWLVQEGCEMSVSSLERWDKLKRRIPGWKDSWVESVQTPEVIYGRVGTSEDASVLKDLPLSRIVEVALENAGHSVSEWTERRPFVGLVKEQPSRAIRALTVASRRGEFPVPLWSEVITHWPPTASNRANRVFCERMRRLPHNVIFKVSSEIGMWLEKQLGAVAKFDEEYAFELFDDLLSGLLAGGESGTSSTLLAIRAGEVEVGASRHTLQHAINSPIRLATEAMLLMLSWRNLPQGHGMPGKFSSRFDRLLDVPGEGKEHAACILAERISWLNHIAPDWVKEKMIPWFKFDHLRCEPAWNGVLRCGEMPNSSVFEQIKDAFVHIFSRLYSWNWNDSAEENAHHWVVSGSVISSAEFAGISFEQARMCARNMTHDGQQEMIRFLGLVGQDNEDGWTKYVVPFIENAWPKETRFQTEKTTHAWMSTLAKADENFPDLLEVVRTYLRPMRSVHYGLFGFTSESGDRNSIILKFPKQTLDFLDLIIPEDPGNAPYDLDGALQSLVDAEPGIVSDHRFARLQELVAS